MNRDTGDTVQLEYQFRPMTPGEEEITWIYEDGIYWKYLRTRRRIATLEGQLRDYNNLDLFLPLDIFRSHTGLSEAIEELNMIITILSGQKTSILFLAELWPSLVIPN